MSLWSLITPVQSSATPAMQNYLPIIGIVVIVGIGFLMMISIRGKINRRNNAIPSPREMIEQIKARGQQRIETHAASTDNMQTIRQMAAKLDNKTAQLEVLIRHADERIASLNKLQAKAISKPSKPKKPQAKFIKPPTPSVHMEEVRQPNPIPQLIDPLTRSVYNLADYGRTSLEIAQELDEQVGKVELILSLRDC